MHVLIDAVHPAHVLFFENLARELIRRGDTVSVVARDKDVTIDLVRRTGLPYEIVRAARRPTRGAQLLELIRRTSRLVRHIRRTRADLVLTRNPAGVQAAWVCRIPGIFDTDDGPAVGSLYQAARPFATVITTPDSLTEDLGPRHRRYRGYKALAYLHPAWFTPDPTIRAELGVGPNERLIVVRLVAMAAVHDAGEAGLTAVQRAQVIDRLTRAGRVVLTSEQADDPTYRDLAMPLPPDRLHDLLAAADLVVGDSQTVTAEAAILGTPALRLSSWTGRLAYLEELEDRYGLVRSFSPDQFDELMGAIDELLDDPHREVRAQSGRDRLLADKEDVTRWYLSLVDEVMSREHRRSRLR